MTYHRIKLLNGSTVYLRDMQEASVLGHTCVSGQCVSATGNRKRELHIIDVTQIVDCTQMYMSRRYAELVENKQESES